MVKYYYCEYKLFVKNFYILTSSGFREDLLGVTTFPEVLNSHYDAELYRHICILKYLL